MQWVYTPHWTALVIFYVISLHTVANLSDDNHYHTAVNIINCKRIPLKFPLATRCLHQPVMKPILPGEEISCTENFVRNSFWIMSAIRRLNLAH